MGVKHVNLGLKHMAAEELDEFIYEFVRSVTFSQAGVRFLTPHPKWIQTVMR